MKYIKINISVWDLFPILAIIMRLASSQTVIASYLFLAFYAMRGHKELIQSMFLCWLFTMINSGIAPDSGFSSIGRYIVFFASALSILLRQGFINQNSKISRLTFLSLLLGIYIALHSFAVSPLVDVSLLKVVSWLLVTITLLKAWDGLDKDERINMEIQVLWGLMTIMVISLPLLLLPIGYLTNGSGFQGIISQPQSFGLTMALLAAVLMGRLLLNKQPSLLEIVSLGACVVLILLSEARIAGFALFFGICVSLIIYRDRYLKTGKNGVVLLGMVIILLITFPFYSNTISHYIQKRSDATGVTELAESSRGALVYPMIENIEKYPFMGIGFGIASIPSMRIIDLDPVLGLPIGASVEKGVMPIAIIEEVGFIGFFLVVGWFAFLIKQAAKNGFVQLLVLITVIGCNFGESIFFSAGGMGGLALIFSTWAVTSKENELRFEQFYV